MSVLVLAYGCSRFVKSPESVALEFIADSPIFRWDGVEGSLKAVDAVRVGEKEWLVRVEFICAHSGYGYREGGRPSYPFSRGTSRRSGSWNRGRGGYRWCLGRARSEAAALTR